MKQFNALVIYWNCYTNEIDLRHSVIVQYQAKLLLLKCQNVITICNCYDITTIYQS